MCVAYILIKNFLVQVVDALHVLMIIPLYSHPFICKGVLPAWHLIWLVDFLMFCRRFWLAHQDLYSSSRPILLTLLFKQDLSWFLKQIETKSWSRVSEISRSIPKNTFKNNDDTCINDHFCRIDCWAVKECKIYLTRVYRKRPTLNWLENQPHSTGFCLKVVWQCLVSGLVGCQEIKIIRKWSGNYPLSFYYLVIFIFSV